LTEKVGYSVGLDPIEIGDDPDVQRVVKGLLDASRLPQEKYQEPATSAQEVGWDMDTEYRNHVPKDAKNKNMCPETKYADNFVTF
jgi:hypothetical protein